MKLIQLLCCALQLICYVFLISNLSAVMRKDIEMLVVVNKWGCTTYVHARILSGQTKEVCRLGMFGPGVFNLAGHEPSRSHKRKIYEPVDIYEQGTAVATTNEPIEIFIAAQKPLVLKISRNEP